MRGLVLILLAGPLALAQPRTDLRGVVPGDALGWETHTLRASVVVHRPTLLNLQIYSPGFDPNDYRRGKGELGDERYDRGRGRVESTFAFYQGPRTLAEARFGVEPHRWVTFFRGELAPGVYTLESKFFGNGKNAFLYRIQTRVPEAAELLLDPVLQLYDVRNPDPEARTKPLAGITAVRSRSWVEPFSLQVEPDALPIRVGFYDEDGPAELEARVHYEGGKIVPRTVSEDRSWAYYEVRQPGLVRFGFRQPEGSRQYSNTIGFKVEGCLEVAPKGAPAQFVLTGPRPIQIEAADTSGRPVEVKTRLRGERVRILELYEVPAGYALKESQALGGEALGPTTLRFGCAGGVARFFFTQTPPPAAEPVPTLDKAWLEAQALLVTPEGERPVELTLEAGGENLRLLEGQGSLELPPGRIPLRLRVEGARVEGPEAVELKAGERRRVLFWVYPQVSLALEAPERLRVGDTVTLTLRARTAFPALLPGELEIALPPCLRPLATPRLTAPLSAGREAVLQVPVEALCRGEASVEGTLAPWGLRETARMRLFEPARFALRKEASTPAAAIGDAVVYRLEVRNTGDEAGTVVLRDLLPEGLEGPSLQETLRLAPEEVQVREVKAYVRPGGARTIVNRAQLLSPEGSLLQQAEAPLQVLQPLGRLSHSLDKPVVVPGETVEVSLRVENAGQAPLRYTLEDTPPEWLEVEGPLRFSGELPPGQAATHTYRARVRFGSEAEGRFSALLRFEGGLVRAENQIQRRLVPLFLEPRPPRVLVSGEAGFALRVENPTNRTLSLSLKLAPGEEALLLGPGEVREVFFSASTERLGRLEQQAVAFVGETPASQPARSTLEVLPLPEPRRLSNIELRFQVEGQGEGLLLTHPLPEGARYEQGSARLDGLPIPDPRVDREGRLFFELPYRAEGVLSYSVDHRGPLPPLEEPTLTLRVGEREVFLRGRVSYKELERTAAMREEERPGWIRAPRPGQVFREDRIPAVLELPYGLTYRLLLNEEEVAQTQLGEATYDPGKGVQTLRFYGLALREGKNRLRVETPQGSDEVEVFLQGRPVRVEIRPLRVLADGRSPLELEVLALDKAGLPSGTGPLTVETSPEPLTPDASPKEAGHQLILQEGRARLSLKPLFTAGEVRVRVRFEDLEAEAHFFALGPGAGLWQTQGSLGVHFGQEVQAFGLFRGYLEAPLGEGRLQAAADGQLRPGGGLESGLRPPADPLERFPLTGAGTEAALPLSSDDPLALRFDTPDLSLGYHRGELGLPGVRGLPQATAFRLQTRGDLALQAFAGWLPQNTRTELIVPDGTRFYRLPTPAEPGSEQVFLQIGGSEKRLERYKDYTLDATGTLTLARPLWPTSTDFQPVRLRVVYAPSEGTRALGYGAGVRYQAGGLSLGGGAAYLAGTGWQWGLEAGFRQEGFGLRLGYGRGSREALELEAMGEAGPLETSASLTLQEKLQGQARLGYRVDENARLSLEHTAAQNNQTGLLLITQLSQGFSVGAGLGYTWEAAALAALGRVGFQEGRARAELTHSQPFTALTPALTQLRSSLALDANLALEGELAHTWGVGLSGSLGLRQKLGGANLALSYQLPGASGEGNRARFGLEAPLPLDERWSLDLTAGYEQSLGSGASQAAFGLAARYRSEGFTATLGGEAAFREGTKLVLRGGATGQLDPQQTLSLDATAQLLPTLEGRFTLAYALRGSDLTLLTYHRLVQAGESTLEGALAASYYPQSSFQLRPSLAYRLKPSDPEASTYQLGLAGNYHLTPWLGLGAGYYHLFQPSTATSARAFSLEVSFRLLEGLWLSAGYTLEGFSGLTPETRPGLYLRLDLLGGSR
ncbi:DUF11 domain-containing protein [Meiothermus sp. QL-1]|uniref:DUF11 domain-containing protein n=1 Tax=Meiothermus sp. QL-1 TaxID=2058095 RepID=UPI000E0AE745|nr:DUF11 domain-containing protein [Meiothermus sp. QL-1]RDI96423.1 DUF11 domain-containing protein [Meiothermus sp. QL-1]